jgi:hypothetical protein
MKKTVLTLLLLAISLTGLFAQGPLGFNYQAAIRNSAGEVVVSTPIGMRISLIRGSIAGETVYTETFSPQTNQFGIVNLTIGSGTPTFGTFSTIDWSTANFFIKVEIDLGGGTAYTEMGTTQLLSVPYANYAFSGNPGSSAYEVWLSLGNSGSEQDFINSLEGPQGPPGPPGPAGTSSWAETGTTISTSKKVGIGTSTPTSMLQVVSDGKADEETPLFEVKNSKGETIFAVYENGVKVFIDETDETSKTRGGFAVSGRTTTKETQDILVVTPEYTRVYVDDDNTKTRGGFAVSGRTTTKELGDADILRVTPGLTEVFVEETQSVKTRGGFAVSGRTTTKEEGIYDLLKVIPERTDVFLKPNPGKFFPDGFTISALSDQYIATELFTVSEQGAFVNTTLSVAPKLNTADVISITQTTAVAGGTVLDYNGSPIWERGVVYSTIAQPTTNIDMSNPSIAGMVWDTTIPEGGFGLYSVSLEYLLPGTNYYVRAFAVNEEGLTGYGAQTSFTTSPPDTLVFYVMNSQTEVSIENAIITLTSWDNPFATPVTNAAGNYTFKVTPGYYSFNVTANGFDEYGGEVYIVTSGTSYESVYMYPQPSKITFRLNNQNGDPVPYAEIQLYNAFEEYQWGYTDTTGLAIVYLSAGEWFYNVNVWEGGYEQHPGGSIIVELGDTTTIVDITLNELPKYTVTFVVQNDAGQPSVGAIVYLNSEGVKSNPKNSKYWNEGVTDADGIVVFSGVPQGEFYYYDVYHDIDGSAWGETPVFEDLTIPITLSPVKDQSTRKKKPSKK